ncbi:hypothetical protein OG280_05910 [Streptomyces virginiae]
MRFSCPRTGINLLGHSLFNIKANSPSQGLRPFRAPDADDLDEV